MLTASLISSASGLGKACCEEICANGGNVAVLDQNEENGEEFAKTLGSSGKFFVCDVLSSESIAKAVQGTAEWAKQSGKPIGGAITAAGVALPSQVCHPVISIKAIHRLIISQKDH